MCLKTFGMCQNDFKRGFGEKMVSDFWNPKRDQNETYHPPQVRDRKTVSVTPGGGDLFLTPKIQKPFFPQNLSQNHSDTSRTSSNTSPTCLDMSSTLFGYVMTHFEIYPTIFRTKSKIYIFPPIFVLKQYYFVLKMVYFEKIPKNTKN